MQGNEFIHFDVYGAIVIGTIQGAARLDTTNAQLFGEALVGHVEQTPDIHLLLNLSKVDYLSSAIITEIIRARNVLQNANGSMRLCGANEYVLNVFKVTGLDKLFSPVHPVREAAEADISCLKGNGKV